MPAWPVCRQRRCRPRSTSAEPLVTKLVDGDLLGGFVWEDERFLTINPLTPGHALKGLTGATALALIPIRGIIDGMAATDTISVPEIHCDHCKTSIEGALKPLDGVTDAEVDVDATTVTVTYDDDTVGRAAIVAVIEEQGYTVPEGS